MKTIKSFTMAEVLITLGIVGIVAAMTLPSLIKNYQKKVTAERLKQTYSLLKQAILLSEAQNGELKDWVLPVSENPSDTKATEKFVRYYIEPYIQTIHRDTLKSSGAPYVYNYYTNDGKLIDTTSHTHYSIALINGVYLHFNATYNEQPSINIRVDINGKQRPNTIGIDTFFISCYPKFGMVNEGSERNSLLAWCKTPGAINNQMSCGALIEADGWVIKEDYPWN